ncbi:MAG: rhodanese-like domain-containing protein [Candidatus Poribacteria bacterium]|jgi:adenylyltransferase/sulfurtransferase|nr:rhodanese-like domain-containing protein [Candidatus Poribacteria bacterium]MDP6961533.1 rhodanese-like domain-containing protein [Dehalococcoidia bacterium]
MLERVKRAIQDLFDRCQFQKPYVPKSAPSAEEAILPFNPADYSIEPQSLKQMVDEGQDFVLLDVRESWESQVACIPGTILIPLRDLPRRVNELNPRQEIVVYCHHGVRSLDAAYLLQQLGFKRVASLIGGIDQWSREIDPTLERY